MASEVLEEYDDLANMGAHLDVAAEQTSCITHDGLDANSVTISKTVHASLFTKCEGTALSLDSLVPRRFGLEAWRVLKEEYEGKGGNRTAALLRGILKPRARWEKMYSEGRDLGDMDSFLGERRCAVQDCRRYLQQAVQVATVMEHAPAALRDLLTVVKLANRESYQALRAYVREWTLAQRTHGDLGLHTTPDTSAPMDVGQVKGERQGQQRQR